MSDLPMPTPGREDVRPHVERLFAEILASQCEKGEAKYRTRLQTFNGRPWSDDALGEAVDLVQYLVQGRLEYAEVLRLAADLAKALNLCHNTLDDAGYVGTADGDICPFCGAKEWEWSERICGNRLKHLDSCPRALAMDAAEAALMAYEALVSGDGKVGR